MRIAALYDIHGNVPALEAVLQEVAAEDFDAIVVGGDVLPGPMPGAALDRLAALDRPVHYLYGNGEQAVLALLEGRPAEGVPPQFVGLMQWTGAQLTPAHQAHIAAWPSTLRFDLPPLGAVLFCHATPRSDTEIFTRLTPEERLRPVFEPAGAALVVCGHTHMPFDRRVGGVRVVNAGSVGMPFGAPGAYWLEIGPSVTFRRTDYDRHAAAVRIRATAYPQADDYAENNVLNPPSEERMLVLFEQRALG